MSAKLKGKGKLVAKLAKIAANVQKSDGVKVGFIDGKTYPDGTPVAQVAYWNEYGATIQIKERTQTIHKKIGKNGELLKNGRFVKKSQSNFAGDHKIGAHTVVIPPRPFFRQMFAEKSPNWGKELGEVLRATQFDTKRSFGLMGVRIKDSLVQSIETFSDPPNATSTIRQKKHSHPLQGKTRLMKKSVSYEVNE